ncbi:MAG TPA: DUF1932 domain-containing protein [Stellaceae bacterium]|nr:DUF1932 domain-containing protein [Stellaceae bacterium]
MNPIVVVIAPGEMGAAVGGRLHESGVEVRTSLAGRSAKSIERAKRHGLVPVDNDAELVADAQFVLSIVPPADAVALARRLAPALAKSRTKPIYVDCNAVSPATVVEVAAALRSAGSPFVDAGIIGSPPQPGSAGPRFYACGPAAARFGELRERGIDIHVMDGDIGTASALKMAYASLTKGLTALGTAMMLAATQAGVADALKRELADSQPMLKAWLERSVPRMYPKAYRWVAEMEEIAAFLGDRSRGAEIFEGVARLYDRIARSYDGDRRDIDALGGFVEG